MRHVRHLRDLGIAAPLRVGLAGPANRRTLWKYALPRWYRQLDPRLGTRVDAVANLLARRTPEPILRERAAAERRDPGPRHRRRPHLHLRRRRQQHGLGERHSHRGAPAGKVASGVRRLRVWRVTDPMAFQSNA